MSKTITKKTKKITKKASIKKATARKTAKTATSKATATTAGYKLVGLKGTKGSRAKLILDNKAEFLKALKAGKVNFLQFFISLAKAGKVKGINPSAYKEVKDLAEAVKAKHGLHIGTTTKGNLIDNLNVNLHFIVSRYNDRKFEAVEIDKSKK